MNRRLLLISEILLRETNYLSIDKIASAVKVSSKTVRNDLNSLYDLFKEYNLELDKKTGSGVIILGSDDDKLGLLSKLKNKLQIIEPYSPEDRKLYIIKMILTSRDYTRISDISSSLYVSSATIYKDLIVIEEWLKEYNLNLTKETYLGIKILGKEKNIRKSLQDVICKNKSYTYLKNLLYNKSNNISHLPSIYEFDSILEIDFSTLHNKLLSVKELELDKLSDELFITLLINIAISINRISNNYYIKLTDDTCKYFSSKLNYKYVEKLCYEISTCFNVQYPSIEIIYILMLISIRRKYFSNDTHINQSKFESTYLPNARIIALNIVYEWENALSIPLSHDYVLLDSLILHLTPVIYRLRFSFPINNPLIDDIKENYASTYKTASLAKNVINTYMDCYIPESEIGFLAIHLMSAIDRYKKKLKTVFISHSSFGMSQFLYTKIQNTFLKIDLVSAKSFTFLDEDELEDVDLIITTIPLNSTIKCNVIVIDSILKNEDIIRLHSLIDRLHNDKNSSIYPY